MTATAAPQRSDFYEVIGKSRKENVQWGVLSIQTGLRFSDELFAMITNRCISELQSKDYYSVSLREKANRTILDTIETNIISLLQLPDYVSDLYPNFLSVVIGQLLRKLNETETQWKSRRVKRKSLRPETSPLKAWKLGTNWTRLPAFSPSMPSSLSPPDPHDIRLHIDDGTDQFVLISIQKIINDPSVTARIHSQVGMVKLLAFLRRK